MRDRLDTLRLKLMLTWNELQERLGVSESMLYFMRTGARNPSPKLLRRIMELETKTGLSVPPSRPLLVREAPAEYGSSVERKHLDMVKLRRQVVEMEHQLAALKRLLEDSNADHG